MKSSKKKASKNRELVLLALSLLLVFTGLLFLEIDGITGAAPLTPNNIADCAILDFPGLYTLTQDVSSTKICFTIESDNVEIDCNGFRMDAEFAIDNSGEYNNLVVKNCVIES